MDTAHISDRLRAVAEAVTEGFEQRMGYPPGENVVHVAASDAAAAELAGEFGGRLPAGVTEFFTSVRDVALPDLSNGYFIGPANWSVSVHRAGEPRAVRMADVNREVVVLASNGGGCLYAMPVDTEEMLVLPPSAVEGGVYFTDSLLAKYFRQVADSFEQFLDRLATVALSGGGTRSTPSADHV